MGWIWLQALELGIMSPDVAVPAVVNFTRYEQETTNFLEPFNLALDREQKGGMAEFVARAQDMILDLDDPSMVIVNDEILDNFLFFQTYQFFRESITATSSPRTEPLNGSISRASGTRCSFPNCELFVSLLCLENLSLFRLPDNQ